MNCLSLNRVPSVPINTVVLVLMNRHPHGSHTSHVVAVVACIQKAGLAFDAHVVRGPDGNTYSDNERVLYHNHHTSLAYCMDQLPVWFPILLPGQIDSVTHVAATIAKCDPSKDGVHVHDWWRHWEEYALTDRTGMHDVYEVMLSALGETEFRPFCSSSVAGPPLEDWEWHHTARPRRRAIGSRVKATLGDVFGVFNAVRIDIRFKNNRSLRTESVNCFLVMHAHLPQIIFQLTGTSAAGEFGSITAPEQVCARVERWLPRLLQVFARTTDIVTRMEQVRVERYKCAQHVNGSVKVEHAHGNVLTTDRWQKVNQWIKTIGKDIVSTYAPVLV